MSRVGNKRSRATRSGIVYLAGSDAARLSFHPLFGKKLAKAGEARKTEFVISVGGEILSSSIAISVSEKDRRNKTVNSGQR